MPSQTESSAAAVLQALQERSAGVPFLALGQTALWDEPVKAVWRDLLDTHAPGSALIAGVHDTDYFAKTSAHVSDAAPFLMLPHDDGRTRDLWSAAGEMSSLFGSESVPTRQMFLTHGVPFDWLARDYPGGKPGLYADKTAAWGWRGIVQTGADHTITHEISVKEMASALLAEWDWAANESLACLKGAALETAQTTANTMRGWITNFLDDCTESCSLAELYQDLLPRFYELLLNRPAELSVTASTQLFRFNTQTCDLPRFGLVNLFLDAKTRGAAREAYDRAVGGSGIYTLETFGAGAIPFDLVIPGLGRGTLRLTPLGPIVETTPVATRVGTGGRVTTVQELARRVEEEFGPDAVLVGKAVTLVDMLAAEHLILFHETASGYTPLTRAFNQKLAASGVSQTLHPIIRIAYETWDALQSVPETVTFRLPAHLASAFGQETISAPEFGRRWRTVVQAQRQRLEDNRALHSTRALMRYLDSHAPDCWCSPIAEYEAALTTLKENAGKSLALKERLTEHKEQRYAWVHQRQELERRKGEDWRLSAAPLREAIFEATARGEDCALLQRELNAHSERRQTEFDAPIRRCIERIQACEDDLRDLKTQRRLTERSPEAQAARETLHRLSYAAQMARLELARTAFLTADSLEHTNARPTAWWLPLVSPGGEWRTALGATMQARLEELV